MTPANDAPSTNNWALDPAELRASRISNHLRQAPLNAVATLVISFVTAILVWPSVPKPWILAWLAGHWLMSLLGLYGWNRSRRRTAVPTRASKRGLRRIVVWAAISGLWWGASSGFLPYLSLSHELALVIVAVSMSAGAAATLAAIPLAAGSYIMAIVVPFAVQFIILQDTVGVGLAAMALTFGLAMLGSTRTVHGLFLDQIIARRANAHILEDINRERKEWFEVSDSDEAYALFDPDYHLVSWNRSYPKILSIPDGRLKRGMPVSEVLRDLTLPVIADRSKDPAHWIEWLSRQDAPVVQSMSDGRWLRSRCRRTSRGYLVVFHEDVSERMRTEEELAQTREEVAARNRLLRATLEAIDQGLMVVDRDMIIQVVNERIRELYGYSDNVIRAGAQYETFVRLNAQTRLDGAPGDIEAAIQEEMREARQHNPLKIEQTLPSGKIVALHRVPMPDGGFVTTMSDVTEYRQAQRQAEHSRTRLEDAINSASQGIIITDKDTRIVLFNEAITNFYPGVSSTMKKGVLFGESLKVATQTGAYGNDPSQAAESMESRLTVFRQANGTPIERTLKDGRHIQIRDWRMRDGGTITVATDISEIHRRETALKESEARLRRSEEKFRSIIENNSDLISVLGMDGKATLYSPSVETTLGYERGEMEGLNAFTLIHPDDLTTVATAFQQVASEPGSTRAMTFRMRRKDGNWRHVQAVGRNALDIPSIAGIIINARDITDQKAAESAAEAAHRHLADAVESSGQAFVLYDTDDRIVLFNSWFLKFHPELKDTTRVGMTFDENMAAALANGSFGSDKVAAERQVLERRRMHLDADGTPLVRHMRDGVDLRVTDMRMRDGGIVSVGTDITELVQREELLRQSEEKLRHSEEYFRALIENSRDMIVLMDKDGMIMFASPSVESQVGFTADELLTRPPFDIVHPDDRDLVQRTFSEIVAIPGRNMQGEFRIRRKDGGFRQVAVVATNASHIPRVNGVVLNMRDITDLREREEQLQQAQKMEAVGQLTGGVAHDFNNFLAVIMGNLQLLEEDLGEDARARKFVDRALRATERGAALTHRLLAFSRRQPLLPQHTNVDDLVLGLRELLARTLGPNIEISTHLATSSTVINVDPNQFESALLNLALNARDAMPQGGRLVIETSTRTIDEHYPLQDGDVSPGTYLVLAVSDSGVGMPAEVLERVFEPFFTTKGVGKGSGLGLSMVYGFAKQSGGHVSIYSELGKGTAVRMFFPVAGQTEAALSAGAEGDGHGDMGSGERILVVEDDEAVRDTARILLTDLGYVPVAVGTAAEALEMLGKDSDFAALFTDVVLPGSMDGVALAQEVRGRYPQIRTLCTSGYTEHTIFFREMAGERLALLEKPYRKEALAAKLTALLSARTEQK